MPHDDERQPMTVGDVESLHSVKDHPSKIFSNRSVRKVALGVVLLLVFMFVLAKTNSRSKPLTAAQSPHQLAETLIYLDPQTRASLVSLPKYFVTFADSKYAGTRKRICQQATDQTIDNKPFFTKVFCNSEDDLSPEFLAKHKHFIDTHKRGYGYWIWKSDVVLTALKQAPEGAAIVFADAGCTLNQEGMPRLLEYIKLAQNADLNILGLHLEDFHQVGTWTKLVTLISLEVNDEELKKAQIAGGIFVAIKNEKTVKFFETFQKLETSRNYTLVDDSKAPFGIQELPQFRAHRHDQSIWTVLLYRGKAAVIPDESWFSGKGEWPKKYPIHATRTKY